MKRVTIFDYGAGNLHSLAKVLASTDLGPTGSAIEVRIESDPVATVDTGLLVLPGVGAFAHAAERLRPGLHVMRDAIVNGLPTLGICLGMQLLFPTSAEGDGDGLGVVAGRVRKLRSNRVPHIGWNHVVPVSRVDLRNQVDSERSGTATVIWPAPRIMYFANSYVCDPDDPTVVVARTTHESDQFVSVVARYRAVGVQFHPEKSSAEGVAFVHNFVRGVFQ
jgi:glutamine amidotransferase